MINTISTIIVDDSQTSINILHEDLNQFEEIKVVSTANNAKDAEELIIKYKPQLMFIDVEMPDKSGLDFVAELKSKIDFDIIIVFYSAFDKYIINVLRAAAFDFLQKPYFPEELDAIIKRVIEKLEENNETVNAPVIKEKELLAVPTSIGFDIVKRSNIVMFRYCSNSRSWQALSHESKQYNLKASITAKELLNLKSTYVQISQSCILNLDFVLSIENKTMRFFLKEPFTDVEAYASRTFFSKLRDKLNTF